MLPCDASLSIVYKPIPRHMKVERLEGTYWVGDLFDTWFLHILAPLMDFDFVLSCSVFSACFRAERVLLSFLSNIFFPSENVRFLRNIENLIFRLTRLHYNIRLLCCCCFLHAKVKKEFFPFSQALTYDISPVTSQVNFVKISSSFYSTAWKVIK